MTCPLASLTHSWVLRLVPSLGPVWVLITPAPSCNFIPTPMTPYISTPPTVPPLHPPPFSLFSTLALYHLLSLIHTSDLSLPPPPPTSLISPGCHSPNLAFSCPFFLHPFFLFCFISIFISHPIHLYSLLSGTSHSPFLLTQYLHSPRNSSMISTCSLPFAFSLTIHLFPTLNSATFSYSLPLLFAFYPLFRLHLNSTTFLYSHFIIYFPVPSLLSTLYSLTGIFIHSLFYFDVYLPSFTIYYLPSP